MWSQNLGSWNEIITGVPLIVHYYKILNKQTCSEPIIFKNEIKLKNSSNNKIPNPLMLNKKNIYIYI